MNSAEGFILVFGLFIAGSNEQNIDIKNNYYNASRLAGEAAYVQSGIKHHIDQNLKDFEKKYIPKEVLRYGSATAILAKTIAEQKLVIAFTF